MTTMLAIEEAIAIGQRLISSNRGYKLKDNLPIHNILSLKSFFKISVRTYLFKVP